MGLLCQPDGGQQAHVVRALVAQVAVVDAAAQDSSPTTTTPAAAPTDARPPKDHRPSGETPLTGETADKVTAAEVAFVKAELLRRGVSPPFGMMAEIPAAILRLEDFLKLGVECVLIGMNDLTGLVLGIERGKDKECFRHPAMRELISMARVKTTTFEVTLSVAGYIDRPFLRMAADIGVDYAVLHYSSLKEMFPGQFPNLPEQNSLRDIKEKTKRMIADFEANRISLAPRASHKMGSTSD